MLESIDNETEDAGDDMTGIMESSVENGDPVYKEKIISLENKVSAHDSEIMILKAALSDTLSRLSLVETELKTANAKKRKESTSSKNSACGTRQRTRSQSSLHPTEINATGANNVVVNENSIPEEKKTSSPLRSISSDSEQSLAKTRSKPRPKPFQPKTTDQSNKEDNGNKDDGKPKIILAKKISVSSYPKKSRKLSSADDVTLRDDTMKFFIRGRGLTLYPPTGYQEENNSGDAPVKKLQLRWVYGYRGKDCRDNLFYLPTGDVVYNIAAVIVLYNAKDRTQRHYTKHTDDVKCLALHPDKVIMASGQVAGHGDEDKKPHVQVWDSTTLETLNSFGHGVFERGLCVVKFSTYENGKFLAAMDDSNDHVLYIYDWDKGTLMTETKASKDPVLGAKWSPTSPLQFVTYGKSHLSFWTWTLDPQGLSKKAAVYEKIPKPKFVQSVAYTNEGDVVSGDSNGNILLFKNGPNINKVSADVIGAHTGGVFCLIYMEEKQAILSCGRDGQFSFWSKDLEKLNDLAKITEQYGPARCIAFDHTDETFYISTAKNCVLQYGEDFSNEEVVTLGHHDELWGLATHPTLPLIATCAQDQLLCIWDCEKMKSIWHYYIEEKGECADFHPKFDYVLVGSRSGTVHFLDYSTFEETVTLSVARDVITDIKISPDGKTIAATSRDTKIYLYTWLDDVRSISKATVMQGHSSRVMHIDWSSDSEYLQSNSSDYELLYWHREAGVQILSPAALRDVCWSTWTCPFGFPVQGIWPEGADGTDINACCRSGDQKIIATADDFGEVKIYRYPSVKPRAVGNVGCGHSSHVTCVRFTNNDSSLISVGGLDSSIMQWSIV